MTSSVIMDYCNSVKLLLSLAVQVLLWKTVTVSPMDVDMGKKHCLLFPSVSFVPHSDGDFSIYFLLNTG